LRATAPAIGGSPRSVGQANGANPIPILIPCHRVVAVAGIGGYSGAGGLETKQYLLDLEGVTVPQAPPHRNRGSLTNHPKTVVARLDPAIRGVPPASGLTDRTPSLKARAGSDGV
jgi:O-6-methylguanine DNA methyltransferase